VLVDEHDPAHKPPGAPRLHSRELAMRRAALEGSRLILLSATPSVESWWRSENRQIARIDPPPDPWPEVITADTRGILRHHPLTLPLTRAIERTTRHGRRVALIVTRAAATLACDECGAVLRCPQCGVALGWAGSRRALTCRLCARTEAAPRVCPECAGHKLSPFGWDAERVEASVRRRFPRLTVSRQDPAAQILIGTATALRGIRAASLGCVGFVALDGLLRVPDFRSAERSFDLLWAAAEAVGAGGQLIVQTLHPEHDAIQSVREQDLGRFYKNEMKFRAELGYPPFRRLCLVSVHGGDASRSRALIAECADAVRGGDGLTVYPPAPRGMAGARAPRWRFVIKGQENLPRLIAPALMPYLERRRRSGAVVEVEMDPQSLG